MYLEKYFKKMIFCIFLDFEGERSPQHPPIGNIITERRNNDLTFSFFFYMHFCPGTITTHAESINSDLQRGLDRRLRHIQH